MSEPKIVYEVDPIYACFIWTGAKDRDGYGICWLGRRPSRAHRVMYEREVGPIPDGQVIDHLCRRRDCIAPHHLEPVTASENELRKSWRRRANRTKCPRGHDMNGNGVVTPEGGRTCRTCGREALAAAGVHRGG